MKTPIQATGIWLLIIMSLIATPAVAQWQELSNPIFPAQTQSLVTLALDPAGKPYVASILDNGGYDELIVQKYDGTKWVQLGHTGLLSYNFFPVLSIAIGPASTPYIAVDSYANGKYWLVVKKYDGSNWVKLKTADTASSQAAVENGRWLAIDTAGTLYMPFRHNLGFIDVLKYDGSSWVSTGNPTMRGLIGGFGFNKKGTLRLDFTYNGNTTMMTYDKASWNVADTSGLNVIGHEAVWRPTINENTEQYTSLINMYKRGPNTIMKLAGNSWATLDTFSQRTEIRGFFPDGTGALNAFVVDHTLQTAALVKHNGTNWIPVNTTAIPYVPNGYSFMIEDTMGHFYIAHSNGTNSGIRVMKYTPRPTTAVKGNIHPGGVSISPIPASQSIWIQSNDPALNGRQATITDIQGRRVYQFTLSASQVIDIQQWSPGIYCLRLPDGSVLKMMKAN